MRFSDIKMLAFDFDGTLANTTAIGKEIFKSIIGVNFDEKEFFGPKTFEVIKNIIENYKLKENPEEIEKLYFEKRKKILKENINKIFKKEDIESLKKLKKKYKLAIITSSNKEKLKIMPKKMSRLFDFIISSECYKKSKPDPEALYLLSKKANIDTKKIAYIGDNIKDIYFAKNANAVAIGKEDLLYSEKELYDAGADYVIKNIKELEELFL